MSKPYHRNLPVPYLSQRENAYIWEEREPQNLGFDDNRIPIPNPKDGQIKHNGIKKTLATSSCNITCLMMVLHYFGVTGNSADHYLRRIFNPEDDCYNVLRATLIRDNFQKKIFGIRNGETVVVNRILFPENEYLPYYAIESNQFGPAFVNTFFKQEGISCSKSFSFIDAKIEDNLSKGLPVVLFTGTTSVPLSFKEYEVPEKGENKDPLKDHLLNNTQSHDYRIDMGEGFDYDKLCEFKEDYLVNEQAIRSSNSTEQEINQARRAIDSIRNQINSYKVALSETHFVVVRGYTETEVIINDPWGEVAKDDLGNVLLRDDGKGYDGMWRYYDEGKSSPFGDNVKIKIDDFKKRYKDDGSCFVWTFEKKSLWDFLYPNVLPKNRKPDLPDYFPCMSHEESYFGGFPVRKAMTWHTGIHVDGFMKPVHSIGPGQLVAARIRDTAPDGEIQLNGSRCFVLIKHQIVMDDEVKEFFSLFYHLWPIYDGEEMLNEFPQERRENCPPWLRQLYSRCYNRAVTWKDVPIYRVNDDSRIGLLQNGITIVIEGKTQKAIKGTERSVLLYELKGEDVYSPEINFRTVFISSDREKEQYRDKVNQLNRGDIAYFDDLPEDDSVVEIGAGQQVGRTGWFNGYLTLSNPDHITRPESSDQAISHSQVKKMCHWEIFSDEILLPDYDDGKHLSESDESKHLSARYITEKLKDSDGFSMGLFRMLEDDGIISNEEFHTFYQDPRIRLPLSQYIIETYSEWSDQMDWKSAYDNAIGFHRNGQRVNTIDGAALYPIEKYIESFRTPHAWFENRMIEAMNPLSDNLFKQGKAVFYHPVRFLQWLIDRDWA